MRKAKDVRDDSHLDGTVVWRPLGSGFLGIMMNPP